MISANLIRQAPPGMDIRRAPAHSEAKLPTDQFTASDDGDKEDKSRLYIAVAGLAVAGAAAAGAVWVTNNVDVPETPPIQIEAPQTSYERVEPQPVIRHQQTPIRQQRPHYQPRQDVYTPRPGFTPPNQTTTINSEGTITVPLGNTGVSIDSEGRTAVDLGPATLRSDGTTDVRIGDRFSIRNDGTTGFRLNENMTIRSDGTVDFHLGGRR